MSFIDSIPKSLNPKTERGYRKKIIDYLNFHPLDFQAQEMLKGFLVEQLKVDLFSQESLTESARTFLIEKGVLLPNPISLEGRTCVVA